MDGKSDEDDDQEGSDMDGYGEEDEDDSDGMAEIPSQDEMKNDLIQAINEEMKEQDDLRK